MKKENWKATALICALLNFSMAIVLSLTVLSFAKAEAQSLSVSSCEGLLPTDWGYAALQSLIEDYGVDVCFDGELRRYHPEVRADMAHMLARGLQRVEALHRNSAITRERFSMLEQKYDEILSDLQTLEQSLR
jgi:hypothetical protein